MKIEIKLGALEDPIVDQVEAQNAYIEEKVAEEAEGWRTAYNLLVVRGFLPHTEKRLLGQRIFDRIMKHIVPKAKGSD